MILYPNQVVADRVAAYSEEVSLKLPDHIPRYHDEVEESSGKRAMYMISNFQAQASIFLACLSGAKRGMFHLALKCSSWLAGLRMAKAACGDPRTRLLIRGLLIAGTSHEKSAANCWHLRTQQS